MGRTGTKKNQIYLDFHKKSFVRDAMASCGSDLWMSTNLDLYNDITNDIENINTDEKSRL
jgi:membrane-bound lytic murein transglycosylase D